MSTGLIKVIKQAALEAMDNRQMCDLRYGTVVSVSPLKVQINIQFTLPSSFLIVPKRLKDTLVVGDKVALLREQGGQSYFILDII